ncbi:uncharacterized protein LOC130494947 [Raphanus sativus]|uniref:Uncharacterized protein LOC130494947 n=1 Tax=Raphanus sativus TaxID=3726 RepID=A0A9W3BRC9_RAPSA|nr:uncharacterized protein LOC130494947 [Raphanus sativus]
MKLRPVARPFVSCQINSGSQAFFWHDDWTGLGPLSTVAGPDGPRVLGISSTARVSEVISGDSWLLPRGRHPIIQLIKACLPANPPDLSSDLPDAFLWRNNPNTVPGRFSASKTWETLHPSPPTVPWHKTIWFKTRIPSMPFYRGWQPSIDSQRETGCSSGNECSYNLSSL